MINNDVLPDLDPNKSQIPIDNFVPDENGGLYLQGFFKISDPESGLIIIQGRA